jgi:hypothetical protein
LLVACRNLQFQVLANPQIRFLLGKKIQHLPPAVKGSWKPKFWPEAAGIMETPINTLMVEGSFDGNPSLFAPLLYGDLSANGQVVVGDEVDQILEMAQYIETRGSRGFVAEIMMQPEGEDKDAVVLRKIIDASNVISSAPERGNLPFLPVPNVDI